MSGSWKGRTKDGAVGKLQISDCERWVCGYMECMHIVRIVQNMLQGDSVCAVCQQRVESVSNVSFTQISEENQINTTCTAPRFRQTSL